MDPGLIHRPVSRAHQEVLQLDMVAEQNHDVFGRPVDRSSITPPTSQAEPQTPRTPRSGDEEDDRRSERQERRDRRQQEREERNANPAEPIGLNFRLTAVETNIRDHTNELAAQRLLLQQVVEAIKQDGSDKQKTEERLNVSFTQHNQKHADHDKEYGGG